MRTKQAKQKMRSVLSLFMAVCMMVSMFHVPVRAAETDTQENSGMSGVYRIYSPQDGTQRMAPGSDNASLGNTVNYSGLKMPEKESTTGFANRAMNWLCRQMLQK